MELSVDVDNLLEQVKVPKRRSEETTCKGEISCKSLHEISVSDSLIDVDKIQFSNDETWLYEAKLSDSAPVKDLHGWLYQDCKEQNKEKFSTENYKLSNEYAKIDAEKNFDSRTFTRPKKRFTRPSIEKYNKDLYGSDSENVSPTLSSPKKIPGSDNYCAQILNSKPLSFDLTQPTTSYYFENLANAPEIDSFQNMSPPSLVNSMCSSTFTNLMESSFINNDPALREIRDTDFTESVLLQDSEPPLFHSFTESCSSMNSDTPENFLRKLSISSSFRKSMIRDFHAAEKEKSASNTTFSVNSTLTGEIDIDGNDEAEIVPKINKTPMGSSNAEITQRTIAEFENRQSPQIVNGTYKRPSKYATYRKSDNKSNPKLDTTFQCSPNKNSQDGTIKHDKNCITSSPLSEVTSNLNSTIIIESPKLKRRFIKQAQKEDSIEDMKQMLNGTHVIMTENTDTTDLNRLSYKSNETLNCTINNDRNISANLNLECSTGSADSLDRMSSLSGSSKGSNKILNMADVDAIVEMQERSLRIMSTPKVHSGQKKLWDQHNISPIVISDKDHFSDSDLSSNDDFKSARSNVSKSSLENGIRSTKNMQYLPEKSQNLQKPRSINTVTGGSRNLESMANAFRGSYTNLKSIGVQNNSQSNLKTLGSTLRGSYTSLRPISAILPVAPPLRKSSSLTTKNPNTTHVIVGPHRKVAEVRPMVGSAEPCETTFVKPLPPRSSGLPRPVGTGIPRPTSSRIPGPRSLKPPSYHQGRQTNDNY